MQVLTSASKAMSVLPPWHVWHTLASQWLQALLLHHLLSPLMAVMFYHHALQQLAAGLCAHTCWIAQEFRVCNVEGGKPAVTH